MQLRYDSEADVIFDRDDAGQIREAIRPLVQLAVAQETIIPC